MYVGYDEIPFLSIRRPVMRKIKVFGIKAAALMLFAVLLFAAGCGAPAETETPSVSDAQKEALISVTSGDTTIEPYRNLIWFSDYTDSGFLAADGASFPYLMHDIADDIPSITLGEDFSIHRAEGVTVNATSIYNENCEQLYFYTDTARFYTLPSGTYYIAIHTSIQGDYIAAADQYEGAVYECVFRLEVEFTGVQLPEGTPAEPEQTSVEWKFYPTLSSRLPAFPFRFDMEYDYISTGCDFGNLIGFDDNDGTGTPQGKTLTFPSGSAVYWAPFSDETEEFALYATIEFALYDEDIGMIHTGKIFVSGTANTGDTMAETVYTAVLGEHDGLSMKPCTDRDGGAVIQ
jgi:hypothetical protein